MTCKQRHYGGIMAIDPSRLIIDRPRREGGATFLFAHGAGAPMDSPFMDAFAAGLAERGLKVVRFEFDYMHGRRLTGRRSPPGRAERLVGQLKEVVEGQVSESLLIGGKSMGGRIASLLAAEQEDIARGLVCLGYPFHPQGKPEKLRTAHLAELRTPTLICQGERDRLGRKEEVGGYALSDMIEMFWLGDGDHDLKPRKSSGTTALENWAMAMDRIEAFARRILV